MSEPRQKPGKSKQDYATPREFIAAVVERFGGIAFDLAASPDNAVVSDYWTEADNSLSKDWTQLHGSLWINPPFGSIEPWAAKCAAIPEIWLHTPGNRILLLVPASVGSNWFLRHVHCRALVLALNPRMSFDGINVFPKDLILAVYGRPPAFDVWRWKDARRVAA